MWSALKLPTAHGRGWRQCPSEATSVLLRAKSVKALTLVKANRAAKPWKGSPSACLLSNGAASFFYALVVNWLFYIFNKDEESLVILCGRYTWPRVWPVRELISFVPLMPHGRKHRNLSFDIITKPTKGVIYFANKRVVESTEELGRHWSHRAPFIPSPWPTGMPLLWRAGRLWPISVT